MSDFAAAPTGAGAPSYTKYEQEHEYHYDNGLIALPVAGTTAKHRIIKLHGGIGTRIVKWHAQRRGKPPVIPNMDDLDYDTFLGGTVTPTLPTPDPQGIGFFWVVSGEYSYVQTRPRIAGNNTFPTGQYPFPVAPNDTIAGQLISQNISDFNDADPATENPYDKLAQKLGEAVNHDNERYLWPFTVLAPQFTSPSVLGI